MDEEIKEFSERELGKYLFEQLIAEGYAPTIEEVLDIASMCVNYLVQEGVFVVDRYEIMEDGDDL